MAITKKELLDFGMIQAVGTAALLFPMEKVISIHEEGEEGGEEDEGKLAICVTQMRNSTELCLMMPDGACLYLGCETIEELKIFEKCILSWEPNY